jgi:GT2 family glycosyltransferase
MAGVKVVAVTPVHNRRRETIQCLRSLLRSRVEDIDLHVVVVDDGSTDGTAEAVRLEFPDVEIIAADGSLWYTAGTNRGLQAALKLDPDLILAFNNDSIFDENCLSRLVACAVRHPRSVVGALLLEWDAPHKVFQVAPRWETWSGGFRHWQNQTVWTVPAAPWQVDLIVGNCVLYPAAAVREVGLMNEKKFPQYGDAEYTPRMRRHGWHLLIEPRARVFCKPNDIVTGFRNLPLASKFRELFVKKTGPYSLQRRFNATLYGAPTKLHGLAAFAVFFLRKLAGRNVEGSWGKQQIEPPLSDVYVGRLIDEPHKPIRSQ